MAETKYIFVTNYFVNELTENIQKAIENLPETYRETFAMSRFGEKTNVQISNIEKGSDLLQSKPHSAIAMP